MQETIINVLVIIIVAIIATVIIPQAKATLGADKLNMLLKYVDLFVYGVEQSIKETGSGIKKKAEVLELIIQKAKELGLTLSDKELDCIIEQSVLKMNKKISDTENTTE